MKKAIQLLLVLFLVFNVFISCENNTKKEKETVYYCPMKCKEEKTYHKEGQCPVCKMDLVAKTKKELASDDDVAISETSIFNLTSEWNTEEGKKIMLTDLKGKILIVVMLYTSCKAACPRLAADMRGIEVKIPKKDKNKVNYVLISIDPKTDTPKKLKEFAIENEMDGEEWTFLQGTEDSVREFANVLSVKYKEISPLDFSHSNIISLFDAKGELIHQQEGLGVNNNELIAETLKLINH